MSHNSPHRIKKPKETTFSKTFVKALRYAADLHQKQFRKRTGRPYIGHLLGVTSIVIEYGGDEEMAIAALLHDAVEDQGGIPRLREIRRKFGNVSRTSWTGVRTPTRSQSRHGWSASGPTLHAWRKSRRM